MKSSNNVIAWAMRNFRITFLIIGCLFLFGIYALARIPKQEFPEYTIRQGGSSVSIPALPSKRSSSSWPGPSNSS